MRFAALALAALASTLTACVSAPPPPAAVAPTEVREPVTLLVSIDGFHPDYLDRGLTPTLFRLAREGASGPMRPSFPTKTFPNHWTLVTGLVPDQHGIVANRMEDTRREGEVFSMATVDPWWWNEAKPLWVQAEEAGIRTASMFWPGSAVPWGGTAVRFGPVPDGTLPSDWQAFSMQVSNEQRVNAVIDWMRRPASIRPKFATLYFDTVDTAGHDAGPNGAEIDAAIADVDRHIGTLVQSFAELNQPVNLVIVSDHGMAATSSDRVIVLDDLVDPAAYRLIETGAYATFVPVEGQEQRLASALEADHAHMECWKKAEIPARYQYGTHPRIPDWFCLPETGWTIVRSASDAAWSGGNHGYDPFDEDMASLFIAHGPAISPGARPQVFANTAIAPLVRSLIGLPNTGPGDQDALKSVLK